ncbi:MAG: hypothetical protein KDK08_20520 [Rhizobiaceae bacterium]|nr:hypothetical protein [Rhizobiaceae bacterium]
MISSTTKRRGTKLVLVAAATSFLVVSPVHSQEPTQPDVCDDCKARELTVGSDGDFRTLTEAFCAFYPGDVIRIKGTLEILQPQIIDGADEDLCEGGARGSEDLVRIAGEHYVAGTRRAPAISQIVIGAGATAMAAFQGQATLTVQNAHVKLEGVTIEASTTGVVVGSDAYVSFVDATIRSGFLPNETMLLVADGGKIFVDGDPANNDHFISDFVSYGLTFVGQTSVALRVSGAAVTLEDIYFGTALEDSPLKSEFNLVAENSKITFGNGVLDFGGFSTAALDVADSAIDGWSLYLNIPNNHFDDRNGERIARGPRPGHTIILRDVSFNKKQFTFGNLYAPVLLSGVKAEELSLAFGYCSKAWVGYDSLVEIENVAAEKVEVKYTLGSLCKPKSTTPYILRGTNAIADLECGGIYDTTQEGCEDNVWGRYRN